MIEQSGLLGNSFSGAFQANHPTYTSFKGLTAYRFISGFRIMASAYFGSTNSKFSDLSLIQSNGEIGSNAFSFGIYKDDAISLDDSFGLYVSQPLSINKGSMTLDIPTARTKYGEVIFEEFDFNLASKKRQRNLKLFYQLNKQTYSVTSKLNLIKNRQGIKGRYAQEDFFEISWARKLN